MIEIWFIYALLSALFAGFFSFFNKISAEKNHNSSLVTTYSNFTAGALGFIGFLFTLNNYSLWYLFLIVPSVNAVFHLIAIHTRIEALKCIHTTLYFPLYKTFGPIMMVIVGFVFFAESLSLFETIGVALGILVPLLLITKIENKRQINLRRGLILLAIGTIAGVISASMAKVITNNNLNIFLFIFIAFTMSGFLSYGAYKVEKNKANGKSLNNSSHYMKRTGVFNGIMLFFSIYFFTVANFGGDIGVVYTINSFSLLIPIILAIFIYKEHFDWKKALAIVLTIASLWFFN